MPSPKKMKFAWQRFMQVFLRVRKEQQQVLTEYQKEVDQEKIKRIKDTLNQ